MVIIDNKVIPPLASVTQVVTVIITQMSPALRSQTLVATMIVAVLIIRGGSSHHGRLTCVSENTHSVYPVTAPSPK